MSSQDNTEHNYTVEDECTTCGLVHLDEIECDTASPKAGRITPIKFEVVPCNDHDYEVCEPCQTALEPAVTEDSDTALLIRDLYKHRIARSGRNAVLDDRICVGGALCNYFDEHIDWSKTSAGLRQGFPHTDTLTDALWQIVLNATTPAEKTVTRSDCKYYASALIEENDTGNYDKAWEIVEEFCEEYSL